MARVEDYTDPHLRTYTPVPPHGDGICDVCHGCPKPGWRRCWSCSQSIGSVSRPIELVVPISLYRVGEQLWEGLRGYKYGWHAHVRERHLLRIAATLHRFMRDHAQCVHDAAGDDWDVVTVVPSKRGREDHPFERAVQLGRDLRRLYRPLLAARHTDQIDRVYGSDDAFAAIEDVGGQRVLLLDDTFTSGATFQSAASALSLAGANVVAGVVIGRVITTNDPRYPFRDEYWERQRRIPFSFDVCCLEDR